MISESEYRPFGRDMRAVTSDLIRRYHGEAGWQSFCDWMGDGSTCPVLDDGTTGIYVDDYRRWLEGLPNDD